MKKLKQILNDPTETQLNMVRRCGDNIIKFIITTTIVALPLMCLIAFISQCESAEATYYSGELTGNLMANGKPYDPFAYTCASWNYPLGTILKVSYKGRSDDITAGNDMLGATYTIRETRSVIVTVTDRHDYKTDIDLAFIPFVDLVKYWDGQGRIKVTIKEIK